MKRVFKENNLVTDNIVFFEHLDNSMGYFLKESGVIDSYINDTHGIAPLEFNLKRSKNIRDYFINKIKYLVAKKLDKKVFCSAIGIYFVSEAMKNYFVDQYKCLAEECTYVVRDGVNRYLCETKIDQKTVDSINVKYNIKKDDKIALFAGNFKDLGGVTDLVKAVEIVINQRKVDNFKVLLVGDGECFDEVKYYISKMQLTDKIFLVRRVKYANLKNYFEVTDMVICPDKQHLFSELVPHVKYFDALVSGKVVLNGSFKAIKEMNRDEQLSIDFTPSNIVDLADKIEQTLQNLNSLKLKYEDTSKLVCDKYSYDNSVTVLINDK